MVIKIAIFLPSLRGGGAEYVMMTLANRFAYLGYKVDLVLVKAVGPYLDQVSPDVCIFDLGKKRTFFSLFSLIGYLKKEQPSVMLASMAHINIIGIVARLIGRVNVRLVISERNNPIADLSTLSFKMRILTFLGFRFLYPLADSILTVSDGVGDSLAVVSKIPRKTIRTIYNPIFSESIKTLSQKEPDHKWFFDHKDYKIILGMGRLSEQKDFSTLIKAFSLAKEKINMKLIILGEGELRVELEKMISDMSLEDYVDLPGFKSNPFSYLSRCDLFVLSSKWEGLPGVLIQAMACGAKVVSTNCPSGPDEILESGRWGKLIPVGDVNAMAESIVNVLNDPNRPSYDKVLSNFSLPCVAEQYLDVLISSK